MSRTYVILTAEEANSINFDLVLETSQSTLRWNNDRTQTFVKYEGDTPSFLSGKTGYSHSEILAILNDPSGEWYTEEEGP